MDVPGASDAFEHPFVKQVLLHGSAGSGIGQEVPILPRRDCHCDPACEIRSNLGQGAGHPGSLKPNPSFSVQDGGAPNRDQFCRSPEASRRGGGNRGATADRDREGVGLDFLPQARKFFQIREDQIREEFSRAYQAVRISGACHPASSRR